ncbi:MAG: LEA type 2 family protein [Desulfobulbaceae bacterium]|uniref:LEA type 2 family protein n=1 Tax=Candidatus Desulfobia pelagia TaxID=2841692 RepID=A0A8J6TGL3_9BACT|nr:LEA type 2 family protein [Candidatus Desulfobia pelagia]
MTTKIWTTLFILSTFLISGCAGLQLNYEEPSVSVTSFKVLPSDSIAPRFEIGLRVINPNRTGLSLRGLSYSVAIEGHKIVSGVSNELPDIAGYGEGEVTLVATANLLSGIRLITDLLQERRDTFTYGFDAKLDTGSWRPAIHVQEYGEFSFSRGSR